MMPVSRTRYQIVTDGPLPYLLSLPTNERSAQAPLLCFLHGYGEAAPLDIDRALTLHGPLRPTSAPRATGEFIIVAPQLPVGGDLWHRVADQVDEVVAAVERAHGVDRRRTYLTGFSFGGNGVFDLGIAQPERWAALWAVDPTRVPSRDLPRPIWLSFGEVSRHRRNAYIRALGLQNAAADLKGERLWSDDGQDHPGTATLAYRDERVYDWLLSKAL